MNWFTWTKLHSVKGRRLRPSLPVEVYRNVNKRGEVWYSVRQNGRVIAHAKSIMLRDVEFVVREGGRQRVLASGRKNVHAFARGYVRYAKGFCDTLGHRAGYDPRCEGRFWVDYQTGWREGPKVYRMGLKNSLAALLNHNGLTVDEPTVLP